MATASTLSPGDSPKAHESVASLHVGVARLFGVYGYVHRSRTSSDFGDFATNHSGVQAHLFGVSPGRGDGEDGYNLSAMPRLYVDYHTTSWWTFGAAVGAFVTAGRRTLSNGGEEQDPFFYASRFGVLGQLRMGREFPFNTSFGMRFTLGPQFSFAQALGDGAKEQVFSLQVSLAGSLYWSPHPTSRISLSPFGDLGVWGRMRQNLRVAGVPASELSGSVTRHGFGVGVSAGLVF